jgi:hydroxymethylpyrimidine kinase/phosphomethylpyrimidine kinase/thiamine-phosphate diphosphorylase
MFVNRAIRLSYSLHHDSHFLTYGAFPEDEIDLPYLSPQPLTALPISFSHCGNDLGLYPVVDSYEWLSVLLPLGVTTIQLRIKNKMGDALEQEIKLSIELAKKYHARLFINDYWEFAIRHDAYGVHLGQEDLQHANLEKIRDANLRLGISTHCYWEAARAHACRPSYIACGPIYATTSKIMPFSPQGIPMLKRWRRTLSSYPIVAIGGINRERLPEVLATDVDGIAMISAITKTEQPLLSTSQFLHVINQWKNNHEPDFARINALSSANQAANH